MVQTSFTCSVDAESKEATLQIAKDKRNDAWLQYSFMILCLTICNAQGKDGKLVCLLGFGKVIMKAKNISGSMKRKDFLRRII